MINNIIESWSAEDDRKAKIDNGVEKIAQITFWGNCVEEIRFFAHLCTKWCTYPKPLIWLYGQHATTRNNSGNNSHLSTTTTIAIRWHCPYGGISKQTKRNRGINERSVHVSASQRQGGKEVQHKNKKQRHHKGRNGAMMMKKHIWREETMLGF